MKQKSLIDVLNQLNTLEQKGFAEITPEEAVEIEGGTVNGGCPISSPINMGCPGNSACGSSPN
ncbi:hypothetical protein [Spirosoma jeollabukense]